MKKSSLSPPLASTRGSVCSTDSSTPSNSSTGSPNAERRPLSQYILADEEREDVGWTIFDSTNEDANGNLGKPRLDLSVLKRIKHFLNDDESASDEAEPSFFDEKTSDVSFKSRVAYPFYDGGASRLAKSESASLPLDVPQASESLPSLQTSPLDARNEADSEWVFDPRKQMERFENDSPVKNSRLNEAPDSNAVTPGFVEENKLEVVRTPDENASTVDVDETCERESNVLRFESETTEETERDETRNDWNAADVSAETIENVNLTENIEQDATLAQNEQEKSKESFAETAGIEATEPLEELDENKEIDASGAIEAVAQNESEEKTQNFLVDFSEEIANTETRQTELEPEIGVLTQKRRKSGEKKTKKNRAFEESPEINAVVSQDVDITQDKETRQNAELLEIKTAVEDAFSPLSTNSAPIELIETPVETKALSESTPFSGPLAPEVLPLQKERISNLTASSVCIRNEKSSRPSKSAERGAKRRMTIFQRFVRLVSQKERTPVVSTDGPESNATLNETKCVDWGVLRKEKHWGKEIGSKKDNEREGQNDGIGVRIEPVSSDDCTGFRNERLNANAETQIASDFESVLTDAGRNFVQNSERTRPVDDFVEIVVAPTFSEFGPICSTFSTLETSFDATFAAPKETESKITR